MNVLANLDERGPRLRFARIMGGETISELATRTNIPGTILNRIECGALRPTLSVHKKFQGAFGVSRDAVEWLLESTTRRAFLREAVAMGLWLGGHAPHIGAAECDLSSLRGSLEAANG